MTPLKEGISNVNEMSKTLNELNQKLEKEINDAFDELVKMMNDRRNELVSIKPLQNNKFLIMEVWDTFTFEAIYFMKCFQ